MQTELEARHWGDSVPRTALPPSAHILGRACRAAGEGAGGRGARASARRRSSARRRAEEEARLKKLDEVARLQREREAEIERRAVVAVQRVQRRAVVRRLLWAARCPRGVTGSRRAARLPRPRRPRAAHGDAAATHRPHPRLAYVCLLVCLS